MKRLLRQEKRLATTFLNDNAKLIQTQISDRGSQDAGPTCWRIYHGKIGENVPLLIDKAVDFMASSQFRECLE